MIVPLETGAGHAVLHQLGCGQGGQGGGDAVHRGLPRSGGGPFLGFDALPVALHFAGVRHRFAGEYVGMAPDQLAVDAGDHVADGEMPGFVGDVGVKGDLDQQVAQLFRKRRRVVGVDGLQYFAGFLQQVALQRLVGLLPAPRAAAGGPQPRHDLGQCLKFVNPPV